MILSLLSILFTHILFFSFFFLPLLSSLNLIHHHNNNNNNYEYIPIPKNDITKWYTISDLCVLSKENGDPIFNFKSRGILNNIFLNC